MAFLGEDSVALVPLDPGEPQHVDAFCQSRDDIYEAVEYRDVTVWGLLDGEFERR